MRKRKMFEAFERVQQSGDINMHDVERGCMLSDLTREEYIDVLKNYSKYKALPPSRSRALEIVSEFASEELTSNYDCDGDDPQFQELRNAIDVLEEWVPEEQETEDDEMEELDDDDEDEGPRRPLTYDAVKAAVDSLPPSEKEKVLAELKNLIKGSQ